jgi:hypothetical protein
VRHDAGAARRSAPAGGGHAARGAAAPGRVPSVAERLCRAPGIHRVRRWKVPARHDRSTPFMPPREAMHGLHGDARFARFPRRSRITNLCAGLFQARRCRAAWEGEARLVCFQAGRARAGGGGVAQYMRWARTHRPSGRGGARGFCCAIVS